MTGTGAMPGKSDAAGAAALRTRFLMPMLVAGGAALVIYIAPIKPQTPNSGLRLLLTIAFFSCVIFAISRLLQPRERWMLARHKELYSNAPPQIELMAKRVLVREQHVVRYLAMAGIGVLSCAAVSVLTAWPQFSFLQGLRGVASLGFLGGLLVVAYLVWSGKSGWAAVTEGRQALREMMDVSDFDPRRAALRTDDIGPPVMRTAGGFLAGGLEWRWDDFHKNAVVFGQPGTGKTVCVLNALLEGLIMSGGPPELGASGLILDPKGDFRSKLRELLRRHGRESDLLVIDPADLEATIRWNPFDSDDDELEVAARFAAVLETLGVKNTQDSFWIDSAKKFLRHAIRLVRLTNPADHPPSIRDVSRLAGSLDAVRERLDLLPVEDGASDVDATLDFFEEWFSLSDRTRSSVQSQLTNMLDPFLMQPYQTVFSGQSTMRIGDMIDRGRILYVHMPVAQKEAMSRTICTLMKLEYYREVLRRVNKQRNSFFLCDEFQVFMTAGAGKGDSDFFERSRQSRHANIVACQNLPALLKQTDQEKSVRNLLSNCAVKVFLRNTDPETNDFAAKLFGQHLVEKASMSASVRGGGRGQSGATLSSDYDYVVRPEAFTRLGIPAPGESEHCESIIHLGSRAKVSMERTRWKIHPI